MTPIEFILQTLIAGAAARHHPAVVDAYHQLKTELSALTPPVDLTRIEERPDSVRGREFLAEDLDTAQADLHPALLTATATLLAALLEQPGTAPTPSIGVDLQQVTAAALTLTDIISPDIAVRLRNSHFAGAIHITRTQAGDLAQPTSPPTNVLVGNTAQSIHIGDKHYSGSDQAALDLDELVQRYLTGLYSECNELPLANEGPVDASRQRLPRLQHVYVDLDTTATGNRRVAYRRLNLTDQQIEVAERMLNALEARTHPKHHTASRLDSEAGMNATDLAPIDQTLGLDEGALAAALTQTMTVFEAIEFNRQLVLLGDPGGGKSTLTRRLAGLLAAKALPALDADEAQWLQELTQCFGRWLLPVRIALSRWAQQLSADATGTADDLIAECVRLLAQTAEVDGLREFFTARLVGEPPTALLLLDGLDEVTDADRRTILLQAVKHFCQRYASVPLMVTCRIRPWQAWQNEDDTLPLPALTIARLSTASIHAFVERWHAELVRTGRYEPVASAQAQRRLLGAIDDPDRKELADMAGTPLLLTMMARVNYDHGLPDSRAELYETYLRQLLWEWEKSKLDDRGQPTSLQRLFNRPRPPVPVNHLELALAKLAFELHTSGGDRDTVDIPETALRRALEALHPGDRPTRAAWAVEVLDLIHDRTGLLKSLDGATFQFSHRTFQEYLAARHLATGDTATVLENFRAKIDDEQWSEAIRLAVGYQIGVQSQYDAALAVLDELLPDQPASAQEWRRVLLLGEIYVRQLGPQRAGLAQQRKRANHLVHFIPTLLTAAMQNPALPPRQRLAAGLLLADLDLDPPGLDDFVTAPGWSFKIARYPVTNKQYRRFVEAGGYTDDRWWQDDHRRRRDQDHWDEPRYWDNDHFNCPTQPVVGVSWYEARSYCVWLTHQLRQTGVITTHEEVRLPTQAQWEQAARSHDDWHYPWGNEFDPTKANTEESNLQQTTPVYMYPHGTTSEGIWDFCGNVWEWTIDVGKAGSPWLKGGSAWDAGKGSTSAARFWLDPNVRVNRFGFRCVIVSLSRG